MPLSEHEQRILAELEESLSSQDPEIAERFRSETLYRHAGRRCWWAAGGFVVGMVMVVALFSSSLVAAFAGVAVMFASAVVFERNLRRMGKAGWYDLNRPRNSEDSHGSNRIEGAMHDAREWFRSRFNRGDR